MQDEESLPVRPGPPGQVVARFPVSIPPREIRSFRVRYRQRLLGHEAVYLVTSALRWPRPIDRAVFVIKHPSHWRRVTLSYPIARRQTADGQTTLLAVKQPFRPDREVTLRWVPGRRKAARLGRVPEFLLSLGLLRTSFASSLLGYMATAMRPRRSSRPRFLATPSSVRNSGTRPSPRKGM